MNASLIPIARLDALSDDTPAHAEADGIDLVLVRRGAAVHLFEGRCPHRGALLADGRVEGAPVAAGLVAAGLVSVLVFPAVAVALLSRVAQPVAP